MDLSGSETVSVGLQALKYNVIRWIGDLSGEAHRLANRYAQGGLLRRALATMLLVWSVIILLHIVHYLAPKLNLDTGPAPVRMMSLNEEWGYGELFAHLLCIVFAVTMLRIYAGTRQRIYAVLAAVFALILIDDSLQGHEAIGRHLAETTGLSSIPYLGSVDVGQIAAFGLLGLLIVAALYHGFRNSNGRDARVGAILVLILCGLGFFAVVVDSLHDALEHSFKGAHLLFTVAEDGGELLMLILACAVALAVSRQGTDLRESASGARP